MKQLTAEQIQENWNMLRSWTPGADSFFEGRNVYRVSNKQDSDLLKKNINKKIYIKVYLDRKYNYEKEQDKKLLFLSDLKKETDNFFKTEMKKLGT